MSKFEKLIGSEQGQFGPTYRAMTMASPPFAAFSAPTTPVPSRPLVLLAQIQRSGGTLMGRLFDHHAQCLAFPGELRLDPASDTKWPELDLAQFDAAKCFDWLFSSKAYHLRLFVTEGYPHSGRAPKGEARHPFVFSPELQFEAFMRQIGTVERPTQRQVLDAFMSSLFTGWLDYQRRYCEKRLIVAHAKRMNWMTEAEKFFRDYPDGFIVSTVRSPAPWFVSARQHEAIVYGDLGQAIGLWAANAENTAAIKARWPDRVAVLCFEDLVERTERTMRRVAGFLGLDYDPILCSPTFNGIPIQSNSSFSPSLGIDASTLERWREHLTAEEMAQIGSATTDAYRRIRKLFLRI